MLKGVVCWLAYKTGFTVRLIGPNPWCSVSVIQILCPPCGKCCLWAYKKLYSQVFIGPKAVRRWGGLQKLGFRQIAGKNPGLVTGKEGGGPARFEIIRFCRLGGGVLPAVRSFSAGKITKVQFLQAEGGVLGPRNRTLFLYIILLRCAVFDKKLRKNLKKCADLGLVGGVLGRLCRGLPVVLRGLMVMCWEDGPRGEVERGILPPFRY